MTKKNTIRQTRIKCSTDGQFYRVEFYPDGHVTRTRCGTEEPEDITPEVQRIAGLLRLGKAPADSGTCAALGALVLHGCEIIRNRPADDDGFIRDLSGWRDIYVRFETNKIVEATMKSLRQKALREARAAAKLAAPPPEVTP